MRMNNLYKTLWQLTWVQDNLRLTHAHFLTINRAVEDQYE
jgi:hypothetical protein